MGAEDGLIIVECLRGRLLAERLTSRNAKETAEQAEMKLVELEAQLKEQIKSRKKAEKRLKLLMKRLQTLKISNPSYDLDESDQSCSFDVSEVTSVSSFASSTSKETEDKNVITKPIISSINSDTQDSIIHIKSSSVVSENYEQGSSLSRLSSFSKGRDIIGDEESFSSFGEACSTRNSHNSKADNQSLYSSSEEHNDNGVGNEEPKTDGVVHDETAKEVVDSLQYVKQNNQISMEPRQMVRVG